MFAHFLSRGSRQKSLQNLGLWTKNRLLKETHENLVQRLTEAVEGLPPRILVHRFLRSMCSCAINI